MKWCNFQILYINVNCNACFDDKVPIKESKGTSPALTTESNAEKKPTDDEELKMVSEAAVTKALSTLTKINEDQNPKTADPQALLTHLKTRVLF